jgi:hypothetical protein
VNGAVKIALGVVGTMFVGGVVWAAFFAPKAAPSQAPQVPQAATVPQLTQGGS